MTAGILPYPDICRKFLSYTEMRLTFTRLMLY